MIQRPPSDGLVAVFFPCRADQVADYDLMETGLKAMRAGLSLFEHKALGRFALLIDAPPGWQPYEGESCPT